MGRPLSPQADGAAFSPTLRLFVFVGGGAGLCAYGHLASAPLVRLAPTAVALAGYGLIAWIVSARTHADRLWPLALADVAVVLTAMAVSGGVGAWLFLLLPPLFLGGLEQNPRRLRTLLGCSIVAYALVAGLWAPRLQLSWELAALNVGLLAVSAAFMLELQRRLRLQLEGNAGQNTKLAAQSEHLRQALRSLERANAELTRRQTAVARTLLHFSSEVAQLAESAQTQSGLQATSARAQAVGALAERMAAFAVVESGEASQTAQPFGLRATVGSILHAFAGPARQRNLELGAEIAPQVPEALIGDVESLTDALRRLLDNAIRYTENGEVLLQVDLEPVALASDSVCSLHFAVRDAGSGAGMDLAPRLFEPITHHHSPGGIGLSLAIVARLAARLGGRAWAGNTPADGGVFHFTARFALSPVITPQARPTVPVRNLPVCLIGLSPSRQRLLLSILSEWHVNARCMSCAEACLHWETEASACRLLFLETVTQGSQELARLSQRQPERNRLILVSETEPHTEIAGTWLRAPFTSVQVWEALLTALGTARPDDEPAQGAQAGR